MKSLHIFRCFCWLLIIFTTRKNHLTSSQQKNKGLSIRERIWAVWLLPIYVYKKRRNIGRDGKFVSLYSNSALINKMLNSKYVGPFISRCKRNETWTIVKSFLSKVSKFVTGLLRKTIFNFSRSERANSPVRLSNMCAS